MLDTYAFLLKDSSKICVEASNPKEAWDKFKEAYLEACASGYVGEIGQLLYRILNRPHRSEYKQFFDPGVSDEDLKEFKAEVRMAKKLQKAF